MKTASPYSQRNVESLSSVVPKFGVVDAAVDGCSIRHWTDCRDFWKNARWWQTTASSRHLRIVQPGGNWKETSPYSPLGLVSERKRRPEMRNMKFKTVLKISWRFDRKGFRTMTETNAALRRNVSILAWFACLNFRAPPPAPPPPFLLLVSSFEIFLCFSCPLQLRFPLSPHRWWGYVFIS